MRQVILNIISPNLLSRILEEQFYLAVPPSTTTSDLQTVLQIKTSIPTVHQQICNGQQLLGGVESLVALGVLPGSTLFLRFDMFTLPPHNGPSVMVVVVVVEQTQNSICGVCSPRDFISMYGFNCELAKKKKFDCVFYHIYVILSCL